MAQTIFPGPMSDDRRLPLLRGVLLSATAGKVCLCLDLAELPAALPDAGPPIALGPDTLPEFRRAVNELAVRQGFASERRQRLLTGSSEAAMNAVQHGGGGEASLCAAPHGTVQVWVRDRGVASGPIPAAADPTRTGYGWWLIAGTVDRVWLCPGPAGMVVVLELDRKDPAALADE